MKGEIWVDSQPHVGSNFLFTATFGMSEGKIQRRQLPAEEILGKKVLVVDDNHTSRQIFEEMLVAQKFKVMQAANGEKATALIRQASKSKQPFDIVVMDWKMPGIDGIETSRRIRAMSALEIQPKIILVTAYAHDEAAQLVKTVGLDGLLIKPVSPSHLFDAFMEAFGRGGARRPARSQLDASIPSLEAIQKARILLVEDNEINQQVAQEILQGAGFQVSLAENGQKAVTAVHESMFDAVLMDIQMPVMDGFQATRAIRQNDTFKNLPIIAMTASAMAQDRDQALESGMNDHVPKPIDPRKLFETLLKWIVLPKEQIAIENPENENMEAHLPPAGSAGEHLPDALPGFDISAGLERLQGNKRLYHKLLVDFGRNYSMAGDEIRRSLHQNDYAQAHRLVHNLKGLAGNLSATELLQAAISLEQRVKGPSASVSQKDLQAAQSGLETALQQALVAVRKLAPAVQTGDQEFSGMDVDFDDVTLELVREAARHMREAIDVGDVETIKGLAADLTDKSEALRPLCRHLVELAEQFDFEGAAHLIRSGFKIP
jgi:CheY-like chemotaxis protein